MPFKLQAEIEKCEVIGQAQLERQNTSAAK